MHICHHNPAIQETQCQSLSCLDRFSLKMRIWCEANGIKHKFIQPGKPTQNSYVECINGSYRRAILDAYIFRNIEEVRELTEKWRLDYNAKRPHEALGNMTPLEYKENS